MKKFLLGLAVAAALTAATFVAILSALDKQEAERQFKARESLLQDSLARTIIRVDANSVEVVKRVTVTKTLRDTLLLRLTDTMAVKEYIYHTDTLRQSCMACVASAARLKVWSDSSIQFWKGRYESVKPSWKDRFGICAGYGATMGPDQRLLHGVNVGVCARVWP